MKKLYFLFLVSFFSVKISAQVVFTESMGSPSGTIAIATHEAANGFDQDAYTYSGTGDIRTSGASSGLYRCNR